MEWFKCLISSGYKSLQYLPVQKRNACCPDRAEHLSQNGSPWSPTSSLQVVLRGHSQLFGLWLFLFCNVFLPYKFWPSSSLSRNHFIRLFLSYIQPQLLYIPDIFWSLEFCECLSACSNVWLSCYRYFWYCSFTDRDSNCLGFSLDVICEIER